MDWDTSKSLLKYSDFCLVHLLLYNIQEKRGYIVTKDVHYYSRDIRNEIMGMLSVKVF
jgi:hypothetical protein